VRLQSKCCAKTNLKNWPHIWDMSEDWISSRRRTTTTFVNSFKIFAIERDTSTTESSTGQAETCRHPSDRCKQPKTSFRRRTETGIAPEKTVDSELIAKTRLGRNRSQAEWTDSDRDWRTRIGIRRFRSLEDRPISICRVTMTAQRPTDRTHRSPSATRTSKLSTKRNVAASSKEKSKSRAEVNDWQSCKQYDVSGEGPATRVTPLGAATNGRVVVLQLNHSLTLISWSEVRDIRRPWTTWLQCRTTSEAFRTVNKMCYFKTTVTIYMLHTFNIYLVEIMINSHKSYVINSSTNFICLKRKKLGRKEEKLCERQRNLKSLNSYCVLIGTHLSEKFYFSILTR